MPNNLKLSQSDIDALSQMAYAENASEPNNVIKMTIQSALNRMLSGKKKEFGANMPEILKKGYYAVSNNTPLYQQAVAGKFPDLQSKSRYAEIKKLTEAIVGDQDYGDVLFYFRPEEIEKLKKRKAFNFNAVKSKGFIGPYQTFSY